MTFEIKDFILAAIFALLGLLISSKIVTLFVDGLGPVTGFLFTSAVVLIMLLILSWLELIIFKFKADGIIKGIGLLLITISFFIVTSQSSCYQNLVMEKDCDICSTYFQSSDGAVWHLWSSLIPVYTTTASGLQLNLVKLQLVRILTYVLTPFILAFLGGILIKGSPEMEY